MYISVSASGYIAQWLERLTADQQVPGSNPGVPFLVYGNSVQYTIYHTCLCTSISAKHIDLGIMQICFVYQGHGRAVKVRRAEPMGSLRVASNPTGVIFAMQILFSGVVPALPSRHFARVV